MKEIVINAHYGGFTLSAEAERELAKLQGKQVFFYIQTKYKHIDGKDEYQRVEPDPEKYLYFTLTKDLGEIVDEIPNGVWFDSSDIPRDDANLIKVVKTLKERSNTNVSSLKIVEIPDDVEWEIEEYDGNEWVSEKHRRAKLFLRKRETLMKKLLAFVLTPLNIMVKECAWCQNRRILGFKRGGKGITSGICQKCSDLLKREVK